MLMNYCAFSKDHKCAKWDEYEFTKEELQELDELCYGNWIEIQRLYKCIDKPRELLEENNIQYPNFI